MITGDVDPDPDMAFLFAADTGSDPNFHFDADPDPAPHRSDANQKSNKLELFMQCLPFKKKIFCWMRGLNPTSLLQFQSLIHAFMKDTYMCI